MCDRDYNQKPNNCVAVCAVGFLGLITCVLRVCVCVVVVVVVVSVHKFEGVCSCARSVCVGVLRARVWCGSSVVFRKPLRRYHPTLEKYSHCLTSVLLRSLSFQFLCVCVCVGLLLFAFAFRLFFVCLCCVVCSCL